MNADRWGRCQCEGTGLIGPRFEQVYCECPVGVSLQRAVLAWRVRPYDEERYTAASWLRMVNAPALDREGRGLSSTRH